MVSLDQRCWTWPIKRILPVFESIKYVLIGVKIQIARNFGFNIAQ